MKGTSIDPLTAVFLRARSDDSDGDSKVCDQTIPVFDGDWRFDLVLSTKRRVKLQKQTPTGYSGYAVICGVKFIPIAGYRPDDPDIKLMSQSNAIEVWLVSLPGTGMYAPYRIVLPTDAGTTSEGRTAANNATVRTLFLIGPDKKIKLMLVYPMSTGRNFDEVLRVLDSIQLTATHKVATPVNWKHGEDVIIVPAVSDEEAKQKYPDGWKAPKPYLRIVPQPK